MTFCKKISNASYFSSVDDIPEKIWQQLDCADDLYLNPKYLSAIAQHHPQIEFAYLVLFDNEQQAIAFATIQVIDFYLDSVQNELKSMVERIKCIGRKLGLISDKKPFRILTSGNTFVSGEHGIFIKNNQNKRQVIKELAEAISHFVNSNTIRQKTVSAYMLKDFTKESLFITDELHDLYYYSFNVDPNMVLKIDTDWKSFDDYLASMKTKFRVKAKKAIERSFSLETLDISEENIDKYLPKMTSLYKSVSSSSRFNLGDFNLASYKTLKENLGDDYVIKAYFLKNKLVGFLSAMVNQNSLDAHFVGIDYKLNRKYAIYQRMLYDYIMMAIDKNLSIINFGRTASEIKSSVGAVPQDLTIYLRHKQSIPNAIIKPFLKRIQPTPFRQNMPFKIKNLVEKV